MYGVMIKIDETLPWIELIGTYQTRRGARKAAEDFLNSTMVKIVAIPEKRKALKAVTSLRVSR